MGTDTRALAAQASSGLAKMVAHEIGNLIFPAEAALSRLRIGTSGTPAERGLQGDLDALRDDLGRLQRFKEWIGRIGSELDQPPERFSIAAALREAQRLVNGDTVELEVRLPDATTVLGFRHRLIIAVVNLLRNAKQHARQRVMLSGEIHQLRVHVTVEDDGPGVAEEDQTRIFLPGFTKRDGGTGTGLAEAKTIVEDEHRGTIGVSKSPLGGARFSIALPT